MRCNWSFYYQYLPQMWMLRIRSIPRKLHTPNLSTLSEKPVYAMLKRSL